MSRWLFQRLGCVAVAAENARVEQKAGRTSKTYTHLQLLRIVEADRPNIPELLDARPRTRGECKNGPRPCPWVGCAHHLYLDVDPKSGHLTVNFPDVEPEDLEESCALDVADRGGERLEEIGDILGVSRERVRQVEQRGLYKLKKAKEQASEGDQ